MCGEGQSDVALMQYGAQHLHEYLVSNGVRVYELQNRILHAKTVTIDGIYASVGTFNFDTYVIHKHILVTLADSAPRSVKMLVSLIGSQFVVTWK
jgi:cardiolipin synthase